VARTAPLHRLQIVGAEKVSKDRFITTQQIVEILDTPQLKDEVRAVRR
jgi:hypothetical protein